MEIEEIKLIVNIVYMVCFFVIGTLFGSFFTLATYRLPRKQDIMVKRSYCPNCEHRLEFLDLIPILSYVLLGGKCRYCKEKISARYPLFELANGLFFLISYCIFGISWILIITLLIYIALFLIVGSSIMNSKMKLQENSNCNNKKGVFNVEILVAVFAFIIYYIATIYTTRNYEDTLIKTKLRSDAMNIAINVIEENKSKPYEDVETVYNEIQKVDDYTFRYSLNVKEYANISVDSNTNVKRLSVNVNYMYDEKAYEVSFETLKYEE